MAVNPAKAAKIFKALAKRADSGDDLAIDYVSRMQRAKAQGFDGATYYRGSLKNTEKVDISKADPEGLFGKSFYVTTSPEDASKHYATKDYDYAVRTSRAKDRGFDIPATDNEGVVYPLKIRKEEILDLTKYSPDDLDKEEIETIIKVFESEFGEYTGIQDLFDKVMDGRDFINAREIITDILPDIPNLVDNDIKMQNEYLRKGLEVIGYKGVKHDADIFEGMDVVEGAEHLALWDASKIRSVNAMFDPAKKKSANLLASMGAGTVATGAMLQSENSSALNTQTAIKRELAKRGLNSQDIQREILSRQSILNAANIGTIQSPKSETAGTIARHLREFETPLGNPTRGLGEYIDKVNYGDDTGILDRLGAIPDPTDFSKIIDHFIEE